jgi:hypothetical protein
MRALEPRVPGVALPLYVVHGMRDLTTSFDAVDDFVRRAGSEDKTFIKVEGAFLCVRGFALVSFERSGADVFGTHPHYTTNQTTIKPKTTNQKIRRPARAADGRRARGQRRRGGGLGY